MIYVGVSAGAFLAANLVNGLSTAQMCRAIVKQEPGEHPFVHSGIFLTPASRELFESGAKLPGCSSRRSTSTSRTPATARCSTP